MARPENHPHAEEAIRLIRSDPTIGEGSCSVIDECYDDEDLIEEFGWSAVDYPFRARTILLKARERHSIWKDRMDDISATAF